MQLSTNENSTTPLKLQRLIMINYMPFNTISFRFLSIIIFILESIYKVMHFILISFKHTFIVD